MIKIENPRFKLKDDSVFELRKKDWEKLEDNVRNIVTVAENEGFTLVEFGFKDSYSQEIERTLKKNLVIRLKKGEMDIDLSMQVPRLIDDNYVIIGGKRKIPILQLCDIPLVTRGKNIKIRTNVASIMVSRVAKLPYINLSFMSGSVPFALVYLANYGAAEILKRYPNIEDIDIDKEPIDMHDAFMHDLHAYYVSSKTSPVEELYEEIGRCYTNYDSKKKGDILVYALNLIPKVDPSTTKFLITGNIFDEIVWALNHSIDDTDLRNKRLRCSEYVILSKVSKAVYDLCITNKGSNKYKVAVNSKQILSDCNVSDIVQLDITVNPIGELTYLSRSSLLGPGGFERANIPTYLRDINESMFGRICPVDTPERENCGVLQSIVPNVDLDSNMRFTDKIMEDQPISIPVSMTPFLEHDDQTRLQMASSQMRQAINLTTFDPPIIRSSCESTYTDHSLFIHKARKDGEVIFVNSRWVIVIYEDKDYDAFNIDIRPTYSDNIDIMSVQVAVGDKVRRGDIIAESNFCKDGSINIGKNLLTAVMPYYGYNYEDAIVVSDRVVRDNIFTSVHSIDLSFVLPYDKILLSLSDKIYKPLPDPDRDLDVYENGRKMEMIKTGDPYAILKSIPDDPLEYYTIFEEKIPLTTKREILVTNVEIFPNKHNTTINQFDDWVEKKFARQLEKEREVQDVLAQHLSRQEAIKFIRDKSLDRFANRGKFKIKGDVVNGMFVSIKGLFTRRIQVGDKIGNRHGNKGVISKIVPHDKMPRFQDGRNVDIIINPLGTISRMNIGQLFELRLGMAVNDLKINTKNMLNKQTPIEDIKNYMIEFVRIIDNTEDKWYSKSFESQIKDAVINEKFIDEFYAIAPPFESSTYDQICKACEHTETKFDYKMFDPIYGQDIINNVSAGVMYFYKMMHMSESKLAARGIGIYTKKTMQPPGGRKVGGGQRAGEMESHCFIAHEALANLNEMLTMKSDCIDLKNKYIRETIGSEFTREDKNIDMTPESVKLLSAYLKVIGVEM